MSKSVLVHDNGKCYHILLQHGVSGEIVPANRQENVTNYSVIKNDANRHHNAVKHTTAHTTKAQNLDLASIYDHGR